MNDPLIDRIMRRVDKAMYWFNKVCGLELLIIVIILFLLWLTVIYEPPVNRVVSQEMKQLMKSKGAQVVMEDWNGNHYFYNKKGQRCRI